MRIAVLGHGVIGRHVCATLEASAGHELKWILERPELATEPKMTSDINEIMSDPTSQNVLVVSSGGALGHFFVRASGPGAQRPFPNTNCMTYVYEWEDGVFTCVDVFRPDFSSLDCGGMDGSGVPSRWELDFDAVRRELSL